MLNTFDNDNAMLLAAVQELTAELATAQGKIAELEKGGGGRGEIYIHITGYTEGTDRPIYTILQRDPKVLDIVLEEGVVDFSTTALMYRVAISTVIDHNIQVVNYDGTLITLNNGKPIETSAFSIMMDIDTGNYYIMQ